MKFGAYRESADFLKDRLGDFVPEVAMVLGSGLGFLGDVVEHPVFVDYRDIPHFKVSTAPGHQGGWSSACSAAGAWRLCRAGCTTMKATPRGDLLPRARAAPSGRHDALRDKRRGRREPHLHARGPHAHHRPHQALRRRPLRGENLPEFGTRFPDASHLYTPKLRRLAREAAAKLGVPLREGIYMYFPGPQYETPAEIRAAHPRRGCGWHVHGAGGHRRRPRGYGRARLHAR
jgi:purine-nucleoside phosphorylase